jgi:hypothetical protein
MKFKALAITLLLAAAPVFAAGVDGNWAGSIDSPNGAIEIKFSFKADGEKLTGNTTGPDGMTVNIKNGKVTGNNLAFTVDIDMGGNAMSFQYTGVMSGDDLKLHTDFMGMPLDFALKRAK